jgi:uncharacterized protein (UPF0332 family)
MANWQDMARDSYGAASSLADARRWRSAASRAYYAVFAIVSFLLVRKGLQMPQGREAPSHARLARMVTDHLTELGDVRWRVFHRIRALYALRLDADYVPSLPVDNTRVRQALAMMAEVFHDLGELN